MSCGVAQAVRSSFGIRGAPVQDVTVPVTEVPNS